MTYDIAIVGGGAAGMCAAVHAAALWPDLKIVLIEALDRVGKKLIVTGNGRCNIVNKRRDSLYYHSDNMHVVNTILQRFDLNVTLDFLSSIGIYVDFLPDGRGYPAGYQASGVVDAFRFALEERGVTVLTSTRVEAIIPRGVLTLKTTAGQLLAKTVILTPGLTAGGEKLGSDGSVYKLLRGMGYKFSPVTPSLVQLKTEPAAVRSLKGIHVDCVATLYKNGKPGASCADEVLFTEYGLSGPAILQISREVSRSNGRFEVGLDLVPKLEIDALRELLFQRRDTLAKRASEEFLTAFSNKRVGQLILKTAGIPFGIPAGEIQDFQITGVAKLLKDLRFTLTGTTGMTNAQVAAGGILLTNFNTKTLESNINPGIFAAGELLDVDGDCGGFNLQWAWSSGMLAAESAVARCRERK
ncbi:MAG: aminoacetone oxidase family FAD-binding enzyme [Ruminococcaceae bacterium]|nr:aminoacetone oxidase family FAD-binding enzyme [Oscillospiraceae bacterium]